MHCLLVGPERKVGPSSTLAMGGKVGKSQVKVKLGEKEFELAVVELIQL